MDLTQQQQNIIQTTGDIKINAVAGSGKTTTIIEYARTRPVESHILYLAFNKSVKNEAIQKFSKQGMGNVKVETAHSLAYKYVVNRYGYQLKQNGYSIYEVAELLKLRKGVGTLDAYILASHIHTFAAYFCNSKVEKVQELDYLDVVSDVKARGYVKHHYKYILEQTRIFLALMDRAEAEITHDFYLKKFQLLSPLLPYDYILFDEGQDASPAMLDVFMKQKNAVKVIVGDTHQQIYAWRFAVNSMEKVGFKDYTLSISFRFGQEIANLAMEVLGWKTHIGIQTQVQITGKGCSEAVKTKAVIGRTNLGLLVKAIEYVVEGGKINRVYFEGNIHSYTYADEGASLYDVLYLYNEQKHRIKDRLIAAMKDLPELEDYVEKTGDVQLGMMVNLVKKYGNRIPHILNEIKSKHVSDAGRANAELIFSTVHRCKGMEYDRVELVPDFVTEEKLLADKGTNKEAPAPAKMNEEINLLYVAVTRARNELYIPEVLIPSGHYSAKHIHVIRKENGGVINLPLKDSQRKVRKRTDKKAYTVEEVRTRHKNAYQPWATEDDDELTIMYCSGEKVKDMAVHFERTRGAIRSRIKKLELEELYG